MSFKRSGNTNWKINDQFVLLCLLTFFPEPWGEEKFTFLNKFRRNCFPFFVHWLHERVGSFGASHFHRIFSFSWPWCDWNTRRTFRDNKWTSRNDSTCYHYRGEGCGRRVITSIYNWSALCLINSFDFFIQFRRADFETCRLLLQNHTRIVFESTRFPNTKNPLLTGKRNKRSNRMLHPRCFLLCYLTGWQTLGSRKMIFIHPLCPCCRINITDFQPNPIDSLYRAVLIDWGGGWRRTTLFPPPVGLPSWASQPDLIAGRRADYRRGIDRSFVPFSFFTGCSKSWAAELKLGTALFLSPTRLTKEQHRRRGTAR